jgi:chemotaxis protein MotB
MSDEPNVPVRIVFKKKKGHGGAHGGAWKVAYADFVTAMMALFIVLWIVGQSTSMKAAISQYFNDPTVFTGGSGGTGILQGVSAASKPTLSLVPVAEKKSEKPDLQDTIAKGMTREMEKLKTEAGNIQKMVASVPEFQKFKEKIEVSVGKEGLRIDLVEQTEGLFFDIGKAHMKPATTQLLKMLAEKIGNLPNTVIIEGYTDARPYAGKDYSNWNLSADRANSARKVLEEYGLKKDQVLQVRGFADRNLKNPDKPFDYSNRRVSILVTLPKVGPAAEAKPAPPQAGAK